MADRVACLHRGKVEVFSNGQTVQRLDSPHQRQRAASREGHEEARIVSITRGRTKGELCYAIDGPTASAVFAQVPGSGKEQRLFHGRGTHLSELDFSFADEALTCSVAGERGTSAIGVLRDDGKGLRTVTEGDVIDRAPRWTPGGRAEIVYASAGIGRTKTGRAVDRSPFALHRLRFSDNSVEVLMADAQYDYTAGIPVSERLLYALRRSYVRPLPASPLTRLSRVFRGLLADAGAMAKLEPGHELVRVTAQGAELVARDVLAFDVAANEDVVYSNAAGVFKISARETTPEPLLDLSCVEQLVIYW